MSDSISREQAIDIVEKYDFDFPQYMERFVTELRDAMKTDIIHDLKHLPSADRPTESDFISKAKVLETYSELYWFDSDCEVVSKAEVDKIYERLQSLPPADRPTGEWISEELANMICNEICYYKEVTVDADSLNDLCEGCLIKKMKYGRLTGKWIKSDILPNGWHCSHCDSPVMTDDIEEMLFCPNCGARMYKGGEDE